MYPAHHTCHPASSYPHAQVAPSSTLRFEQTDAHLAVYGHDLASLPDDPITLSCGTETSLRKWMTRLSSGKEGVLRLWSKLPLASDPPADDRYIDFSIHKTEPTVTRLPPSRLRQS